MSTTPKFALTRLTEGQASAEITYNGDLNLIDSLMHCAIEDRDLATPPGSPVEGASYIVAGSPTGLWTGHAGDIAIYFSGWYFVDPFEGLTVRVKDENISLTYDGAAWVNATTALGLGTVATLASDTDGTLAANSDTRVATQKATKTYVDNLVTGLKWKASVVVATTSAVTLATGFENGDTIDGVVLATGDRVLNKDAAAPAENGVYVVAASGAPARATDADSGTELVSAAVFVQKGTVNADKAFVCTNDSITLGSTSIVFTGFLSALGSLIASNNLSDLISASTARTNLGLGTGALLVTDTDTSLAANSDSNVATQKATKTYADLKLAKASNLSDVANAATARTNLSLVPGTHVQAWSAQLDSAAAMATLGLAVRTAANTITARSMAVADTDRMSITNPAGTAGNPTYDVAPKVYRPAYNMRDGTIAQVFDRMTRGVSMGAITGGTAYVMAIPLFKGDVITSIGIALAVTASGPTHWWYALLDSSRVVLAVTADQTSTAQTSGFNDVNLTAPYTILASGLFYLVFMNTATVTVCSPMTYGTTSGAQTGHLASVPIISGTADTGMTGPPSVSSTMAALTVSGSPFLMWCK
jgi:hypothetical protein